MANLNKIMTTSGGLMLTQAAVEDLLNRSNSAFSSRGQDSSALDVLSEQVAQLEKLKNQALLVEQEFYKELNIDIGAKGYKGALTELQDRLNDIGSVSGLDILVKNPYIIASKFEQYFDTLSSETVLEILNKPENLQALANQLPNQVEYIRSIDELIDSLNTTLNIGNSRNVTYFYKTRKGQGSVNLTKKLVFDEHNGKFSLNTDMALDANTKTKIVQAINKANGVNNSTVSLKNVSEWYDDILEEILHYVTSEKAANFIKMEFYKNIKTSDVPKYFLNRNEAVFRGFLAELHNNVILDLLFNEPTAVEPTGNLKTLLENGKSGGSLPIDAVLKAYNFQVKGYTLQNEAITFQDQHGAGYFINNRANITGDLGELLTELFASYQFNQLFSQTAMEKINAPDTNYEGTYSRFGGILANSQKVFQGYISNIIRLVSVFKSTIPTFSEEKLYMNTFFNISGQFVPASAIIEAIILSLKKAHASSIIKFQINDISKGSDQYTLGAIIENSAGYTKREWRSNISYSARDIADQVKIRWSVQMNLQEILREAYNNLSF